MSAQVDQFCDKLRDRLDTLEVRVQSAKSGIRNLPERGEDAVRAKFEESRNDLQARKERFEQSAANMKARAQQRVAATKEEISQWKAQREVRKLNARADRADGRDSMDGLNHGGSFGGNGGRGDRRPWEPDERHEPPDVSGADGIWPLPSRCVVHRELHAARQSGKTGRQQGPGLGLAWDSAAPGA